MSHLEKRLQILLDRNQYERVKSEADRSGQSVGAVVRSAIDMQVPALTAQVRAEAAGRLLDRHRDPEPGPAEEWADIKRSFEEEMERHGT